MEHRTARYFVISGRVQGVGYRSFAQHAARALGATGWARNLANGDVEVHANGTPSQLDDLEARLRQGPHWAEVRTVTATEASVTGGSGFEVR
ncbi:MAG: acylphosphatase [Acidobacteriota bacterium]